MGDKKGKRAFTDAEMGRFANVASGTQQGIQHAIELLLARKHLPSVTMDERRKIDVTVAKLRADLARIRAKEVAFLAMSASLRPPSPADVGEVTALADRLEGMTSETTSTTALVRLATGFASLFRRMG